MAIDDEIIGEFYLCLKEQVSIAGDACILNKSFEMGVASGTSSAALEQDQKTLDKIIQFIQDNPNVELWCGHDFPR